MEDKIKVVVCHPGEPAVVTEINSDLESMQDFVGGMIQAVYPFEDQVCIVCNDEAKLMGMPLNRGLSSPEYGMYDVIAGSFFICGCGEENFCSLTEEQQKKYREQFKHPEVFVSTAHGIQAIKLPAHEIKEKTHKISRTR